MLSTWLSPSPLAAFVRDHLRQQPHARPGAAAAAVPLLDWSRLDRILASAPPPDVLVASAGRLVDMPAPRHLAAAHRCLRRGAGIVVRKSERHDPALAELAESFARDLPGAVHVQLYATPEGTHTFGWHFDEEDVFIVQTAGAKDYYFRANTVTPPGVPRSPDFSKVRDEKSPLMSARLLPGDWLYIPSRWWHLVRSLDDALSISIGVTLS